VVPALQTESSSTSAVGRDDARTLDAIGPAQLGLLDRHRTVAVTAVLADPERSLLLGR